GRDHANFNLDAEGDALRLYGTNLALLDTVSFGGQLAGVSEGRWPDGSTNIAKFPGSATPGEGNYLLVPNAVINEVLTHANTPLEGAIELLNPTASPTPLGGWYLSNSRDNFKKYRIADGTTIPANGYLVFYENQFNNGILNSFALDR